MSGSLAKSSVSYTFRRFPQVFAGIRGSFRGVSAGIREVSGPLCSADEVSGSVANRSVPIFWIVFLEFSWVSADRFGVFRLVSGKYRGCSPGRKLAV